MEKKESYSVTQILARFAVETCFDDLPEDVIKQSKRIILDTIGAALGGYTTDIGMKTVKFSFIFILITMSLIFISYNGIFAQTKSLNLCEKTIPECNFA